MPLMLFFNLLDNILDILVHGSVSIFEILIEFIFSGFNLRKKLLCQNYILLIDTFLILMGVSTDQSQILLGIYFLSLRHQIWQTLLRRVWPCRYVVAIRIEQQRVKWLQQLLRLLYRSILFDLSYFHNLSLKLTKTVYVYNLYLYILFNQNLDALKCYKQEFDQHSIFLNINVDLTEFVRNRNFHLFVNFYD